MRKSRKGTRGNRADSSKAQPPASTHPERPQVSREEVLKFLESTTQHYGTYHNQKESSAWASVALFVVATGQLLQHRASVDVLPYAQTIPLASLLTLLGGATLIFMRHQFALRRRAAELVAASFRVRCTLISEPSLLPKTTALQVPEGEFLPRIVLDEVRQLGTVGTARIGSLERGAYLLVALVGLWAIFRTIN